MMGLIPRSPFLWPSRAKSMMSLRAGLAIRLTLFVVSVVVYTLIDLLAWCWFKTSNIVFYPRILGVVVFLFSCV